MLMTPGLRKFVLAVHLTFSVGWIGTVAAYLPFDVAVVSSQDAQTLRAAYFAMDLIITWAIVPFAFASLITGLVISLGTKWGLFRHYWVLISLLLTVVAIVVLLNEAQVVSRWADIAADPRTSSDALRSLGSSLLHSVGGLVVLLVIMVLNVYKPRGLTRYGWRKQYEERARLGAATVGIQPPTSLARPVTKEGAMQTRFSLEGARSIHSFAHHHHSESGEASAKGTQGLILNLGWRYDLVEWFLDTFLFRGKLRELRQRTANLARMQPGDKVLDVGCGTGTLAIEVQQIVGEMGRVFGVDPGTQQIARARSKAARRNLPIDFQVGVIEHLTFPDQTFNVVFSTIMMHHLPDDLKRRGLSEIIRVLKPGGRLVVADFQRPEERQDQSTRFGAGGSDIQDLAALVRDAGFSQVETEEMRLPRFSAHPGAAGFVRAHKS